MTGDLTVLDAVVIVIYLVGITALGVWMARRVHSLADYFMPRRFGKAAMIMHAFGTGTASDQAVVVSAASFRSGLSGIWYQWLWLFATPFYWLIAPLVRRFRAVTVSDVLRLRFDPGVAVLYAIVAIVGMAVKIGLLLKGSGALIDSGTGGLVDANVAIAVVTVLFVLYGAAGGLGAAIVTDFIQGILTILFSFILLPFVLAEVGGMQGIRETIQKPGMLSLVAPGEIGVFFIVMLSLQSLIGIIAQPYIIGVCGAGRTEMDGRVGFTVGNFVKRFCTIAWCVTGVAAVAWYLGQGVEPGTIPGDEVYGNLARAFLPRVAPGLLGVFLAALLAGVMSSCDSFMIASSALFTENIYRPVTPGRSSGHYIWVGRGAGLAVVAGGLIFAYWVPNVVAALKIWLKIAPMMGIAIWMALVWRRINAAGAWAAALAGFGTWFLATRDFFVRWMQEQPLAQSLGVVWQPEGKTATIYEPWTILFYTTAAVVAAIVTSLLTRPVAREKLERFYALMRTPVRPGEKIDEPCTLPAGVSPTRRVVPLRSLGLEIPVPSATSAVGFFLAWLMVGALIGGFVLLVQ